MKETWGNHLLEKISVNISDGYCIRNLKSAFKKTLVLVDSGKSLYGTVYTLGIYLKFVFFAMLTDLV